MEMNDGEDLAQHTIGPQQTLSPFSQIWREEILGHFMYSAARVMLEGKMELRGMGGDLGLDLSPWWGNTPERRQRGWAESPSWQDQKGPRGPSLVIV